MTAKDWDRRSSESVCGEIQFGKKIFLRMKGKVYKSSKISNFIWKRNRSLKENKIAIFEKSRKIYGKSDMLCKVGRQEEYSGANGHGIKGSRRKTGKDEWCEVVWSCFETT